jgi:catechol 2,3-dioxygenase-like lactoylglutathione lyase family enzyme
MTVQRLEHIGIVVDDLAAATAFFAALGLELEGEASVEGGSVDRINGLEGVRADIVMLRTPDGNGKVELAKYRSPSYEGDDGPAPTNAPGIRHILFVVDDIEASLAGLRAHGGELVGGLPSPIGAGAFPATRCAPCWSRSWCTTSTTRPRTTARTPRSSSTSAPCTAVTGEARTTSAPRSSAPASSASPEAYAPQLR